MSALCWTTPHIRETTDVVLDRVLIPDIVVRGVGCVTARRHLGELFDVKQKQSAALGSHRYRGRHCSNTPPPGLRAQHLKNRLEYHVRCCLP